MKDRCGDGTILYLHFRGEYSNLHMIKLYRTEYYTQTNEFRENWKNLPKINGLCQCQ